MGRVRLSLIIPLKRRPTDFVGWIDGGKPSRVQLETPRKPLRGGRVSILSLPTAGLLWPGGFNSASVRQTRSHQYRRDWCGPVCDATKF